MRGLHGDTTGHSLILLNIKLNPNNAAEISLSEYSSWLGDSCLVWVSALYKCYAFIFFSYVIWRNILNKEVTFYSIPRTEVAQKGGKMMLFVSSDLRWIYRSGGIFSSPGVRTVLSTGQLAKTRQGRGLQLSNLARDKSAELSVKGNFQTIMEYSRPWRTNIFFFNFKRPYSFNFVNNIPM